MRRIHLLSTVLGTVLLASPALAQRDAMSEMQHGKGSSAMPSVPMQNRNAGMADQMGGGTPTQWFKEAQDAVRRNQLGRAAELLERAETRMLSRSVMGEGERPAQGPVVQHSSAARQALMQRDRQTAMREIDQAMSAAGTMSADSSWGGGMSRGGSMSGSMSRGGTSGGDYATGSSMGNQPVQGGGSGPSLGRSGMGQSGMQVQPGPAQGSTTWRDHGMGGSSMSRADLLILAQAGGGGGGGGGGAGGGGSGGGGDEGSRAESAYPGSPFAGQGSLPQNPRAGTAVPAVPTEGRGPPIPGRNVPSTDSRTGNTGGAITGSPR